MYGRDAGLSGALDEAQAKMTTAEKRMGGERRLIKRLLKKHKYPPEGMDDADQTVMTQCELWADNNEMRESVLIQTG